MDETALARAYRNTAYCVDHPTGNFSLRIGETCTALDTLLRAHGVTNGAFVTACNPRSQPLPPAENAARHAQLLARVKAHGWTAFAGRGVAEGGDWIEESLLILGIDEAAAVNLGLAFGQNAVVIGDAGGVARLRWCGTPA
jgi:predicted amidohydrolase